MNSVLLYQEFRLVERNENEVSVVWKGAHLVLFFLTFVFGSFCTFFFHVLMYMFDQKCVLFPELVPHSSLRKIVYEFFTINADDVDFPNNENVNELPVDFMSTQWVEDSVCYLPTYVPLVSGLCGLIWTTMFLMCSSGASSPAGMQRQWRALPLIFVFSLAMGSLCTYASTITNNGLEDLCNKLGRLTGSDSCTYTINVATLGYERRIRGVYQATRLTIATAWLHTSCWLLSAVLTLVRVLLAIDFQLVSVKVELLGDIERMMEKYERHVRCVSPDSTGLTEDRLSYALDDVKSVYSDSLATETGTPPQKHVETGTETEKKGTENAKHVFYVNPVDAIFVSEFSEPPSMTSLVEDERHKLYVKPVLSEHQFIIKLLYNCLDDLELPSSEELLSEHIVEDNQAIKVHRQQGLANIFTTPIGSSQPLNVQGTGEVNRTVGQHVHELIDTFTSNMLSPEERSDIRVTEQKSEDHHKKSNLKTKGVHTSRKVHISSVVKLEEPEKGKPEIKSEEENKDGQGTSEDAQDTSKSVHTSRKVQTSSVVKLEEPEEGKPEIKSEKENKDGQGNSEDAQDTSKSVHTSRKVHTLSVVKLEESEEAKPEIKSEKENKEGQGTSEDAQDTSKGVHTSRKVHTSSVVKLKEPEEGKPEIKSEEENKDGQGTSEDAQDTSNANEKKAQTPEEKQN